MAVHHGRRRRCTPGFQAKAVVRPTLNEPAHISCDGVNVLDVFFDRVGVIEAEVALTAVFARDAEIEANRLGVADVEIAVGLRRKARDDLRVPLRRKVLRHDIPNEVAGRGYCARRAGPGVLDGHKERSCEPFRREATAIYEVLVPLTELRARS
jgi:hypothetical protein